MHSYYVINISHHSPVDRTYNPPLRLTFVMSASRVHQVPVLSAIGGKGRNTSTEVQVVVSLDELVRDFESENNEVATVNMTMDNHMDECGKGQQYQTSIEMLGCPTNWAASFTG